MTADTLFRLESAMHAALIIIEVQRSLVEDETWEPDRVLDRVCALEGAARSAGAPIFYVADSRVEPMRSFIPD